MKYFETQDYTSRDKEFDRVADYLTASSLILILHFLDNYMTISVKLKGNDVIITTPDCRGIIYTLILKNCHADECIFTVDWYELSKNGNRFFLELADDEENIISFDFSDAVIEKQSVNALWGYCYIINDSVNYAKHYLSQIADSIVLHNENDIATEREKSILPLAEYFHSYSDDDDIPAIFMKLSEKHNITDLVQKYKNKKDKLFSKLFVPKYKEFLLDIYNIFKESQIGIPTPTEVLGIDNEFEEFKSKVTMEFNKLNFTGEYPLFHNDKGMLYCYEEYFDGDFTFQCACFKTKDIKNIPTYFEYLLNIADDQFNFITSMFVSNNTDLEKVNQNVIAIAAKYINSIKLTKEEEKYSFTAHKEKFTIIIILLFFLFCSVISGFCVMVAFMLIEFIITMVVTGFSFSIFAELFMDTPWWLVGSASGVFVGLSVTIIMEVVPRIKNLFKR